MAPRMLCGDCGETAFAQTRLEGSDVVESVGWLLGALPGWLYCAWRFALRTKVCAHCGSVALVRETRAAAAREPAAPPAGGVRVVSRRGELRWPAHLRDPRDRMRWGGAWLGAWIFALAGLPQLGALLACGWLAAQSVWCARRCAGPERCRAWDAEGRALRIEQV